RAGEHHGAARDPRRRGRRDRGRRRAGDARGRGVSLHDAGRGLERRGARRGARRLRAYAHRTRAVGGAGQRGRGGPQARHGPREPVSPYAPARPRAAAERGGMTRTAVRRYNAPTTTRLVGRARLPHGNEWRGDVAVRNGTVVVAGRVDGTLLVINGDAILDTGAVVTGDVIVVGGTVARSPTAMVSGELRVYTAPLAYRIRGEEIALAPPDLRRWFRRLGIEKSWGTADSRSSLTLATGGTFTRVEGLPGVFGPLFDWKLHSNVRLRVDPLGVSRTAGALPHQRTDA